MPHENSVTEQADNGLWYNRSYNVWPRDLQGPFMFPDTAVGAAQRRSNAYDPLYIHGPLSPLGADMQMPNRPPAGTPGPMGGPKIPTNGLGQQPGPFDALVRILMMLKARGGQGMPQQPQAPQPMPFSRGQNPMEP